MTHTPGPWTLEGGTSGTFDADGERHPLVTGPNGENPICVFEGNWAGEWDDARLIAAAPDLYAALLDFAIPIAALVLEGVTLDRYVTPEIARELRRVEPLARAALLKAKGQP